MSATPTQSWGTDGARGLAARVADLLTQLAALGARHAGLGWALATLLIYLPSLPGPYLVYDDAWLIQENPILDWGLGAAARAIFADFTFETRLALGAEYLPLRDLSYWLDVQLWGRHPQPMRLVQLALYVVAIGLLRAALLRCLESRATAEVATGCFALHPAHVESVAWLAGRKDVLALLFVCAAAYVYESRGRLRLAVPALLLMAYFSKSMSIVACGLLLAQDLLARRRPRFGLLGISCAAGVFALWVHWRVGARVSMVGGPLSGDRAHALLTMGEVWLEYVKLSLYPPALSVVHDVEPLRSVSFASVVGWLLLVGSGVGALVSARQRPALLGIWLWAVLPLAPVSQFLVPLQNVLADRYLWLSVLALGLALGFSWNKGAVGKGLAVAALSVLACGSAWRATLFGDGALLFADATRKTTGSGAPYNLAMTLEGRGDLEGAAAAYALAIQRPCSDCEPARRASNNLARLLVRAGAPEEAELVLRAAVERWPSDPKARFNLVKALTRAGKAEEARALYAEARSRFPDYVPEHRAPGEE